METIHTPPLLTEHDEGTKNQRESQASILKSLSELVDINALEFTDVSSTTDNEKGLDYPVGIEAYEPFRITDTTPIEPPIPVITIAGEVISTEGNITTFSGASKAGKSALTAICIAGAICEPGRVDGINGLDVEPNLTNKAVIHIDTEQAKHRQQNTVRAIIRRAKLRTCPDHYLSYNIRELDLDKYGEITEGIFAGANSDFGGIHLAVIDGLADYIKDVNDGEDSNAIIKFVEGLAIKYRVPIIVIVHTNPGSDKERGHLGSQLQRKSESVLAVKLEGDISFIEPKFLRMAGKGNIPQLSFKYCQEKGYHIDNGVMIDSEDRKEAIKFEMISNLCKTVFSGQVSYGYKEAIQHIEKASGKKTATAKGYFTIMKENEIIIQGDDNNWRYSGLTPV
jgi:hypothetical protein